MVGRRLEGASSSSSTERPLQESRSEAAGNGSGGSSSTVSNRKVDIDEPRETRDVLESIGSSPVKPPKAAESGASRWLDSCLWTLLVVLVRASLNLSRTEGRLDWLAMCSLLLFGSCRAWAGAGDDGGGVDGTAGGTVAGDGGAVGSAGGAEGVRLEARRGKNPPPAVTSVWVRAAMFG